MKTYAQVENDVVVNTVVADANWAGLSDGEWIEYTHANPCGIGWAVENGACVLPEPQSIPFPIEVSE
jgi:hypothetical protein